MERIQHRERNNMLVSSIAFNFTLLCFLTCETLQKKDISSEYYIGSLRRETMKAKHFIFGQYVLLFFLCIPCFYYSFPIKPFNGLF